MRCQDTIANGGSITGIASRLKQVAVKVDNDPARIRKHIEAEIAALHEELDQLDAGQRPQPDVTDCYDEARAIALQMERLITDIGQYGTMIEQATAALDEPIDSNADYRDRQRQMYTDYQAAWVSPNPSPPSWSRHVTTEADIDFSSLPQGDQNTRPPVQRRPRFDGDISNALQHLLTRRYISAEADADVHSCVLE